MNDDLAIIKAADVIKLFEGCELVAYQDAVGVWTIGWGESEKVDKSIRAGMVWSRQHADARLMSRINAVLAAVKATWPGAYRLNPSALAALISLAYNRGTDLTKRARDPEDRRREMRELQPAVIARDYTRMAQLFRSMKRLWEGKGLAGLIKRRELEACMCENAAKEV